MEYLVVASSYGAAAVSLMYMAIRIREHHALNNLPTAGEASRLSLGRLFTLAMHAERARSRQKRRAISRAFSLRRLHILAYVWVAFRIVRTVRVIPTRAYRGLTLLLCLSSLLRVVDDIVDEHAAPLKGTREDLFKHITQLIACLDEPDSLDGPIRPEEVLFFFIVNGCKALGIDAVDLLQRAWEEYEPYASCLMKKLIVLDQRTLDRATRANVLLYVLGGRMIGLSELLAWRHAKLSTASNLECDNMRDLLRDIKARQFTISIEVFETVSFTPEDLLSAESWDDLAAIPGLPELCAAQAKKGGEDWSRHMPLLEREVLPHVKPWPVRKVLCTAWRKRTELYERYSAYWGSKVTTAASG